MGDWFEYYCSLQKGPLVPILCTGSRDHNYIGKIQSRVLVGQPAQSSSSIKDGFYVCWRRRFTAYTISICINITFLFQPGKWFMKIGNIVEAHFTLFLYSTSRSINVKKHSLNSWKTRTFSETVATTCWRFTARGALPAYELDFQGSYGVEDDVRGKTLELHVELQLGLTKFSRSPST